MSILAPLIRQRFLDSNGLPLSGGQLFSYAAGTTTLQSTYTDQSGSAFNTNPIILDAAGYCDVWLGGLTYKFVLEDANGVIQWTKDNISIDASIADPITYTHSVANIAALQAISAANRSDGLTIFVESVALFFYFNAASTATSDSVTVVTPTAGSGRWIVVNQPSILTGTRATPQLITASGGIAFVGQATTNTWFISGNGGAITVTANPRIAAATNVGQRLFLIGRDNTNTVTIADGNGLDLNGEMIFGAGSSLELLWDGTNWIEMGRSQR